MKKEGRETSNATMSCKVDSGQHFDFTFTRMMTASDVDNTIVCMRMHGSSHWLRVLDIYLQVAA